MSTMTINDAGKAADAEFAAPSPRQGVHGDAREGPRRARRLRRRAAEHDAFRGGGAHRSHPRNGAPDPPTLAALGYLLHNGRQFSLAPRILELGFAYLSTQSWIDRAEPMMKELSHDVGESCSAAILQEVDIVYVARMPAPHRLMSVSIAIGSRLPAFYSALGRIQLGLSCRGRDLAAAQDDPAPSLHAAHHRRPAGIGRARPRRPCTRILDRRRGTGNGTSRHRRAGPVAKRRMRRGDQHLRPRQPRYTQRNARGVPRAAAEGRRRDLPDNRLIDGRRPPCARWILILRLVASRPMPSRQHDHERRWE